MKILLLSLMLSPIFQSPAVEKESTENMARASQILKAVNEENVKLVDLLDVIDEALEENNAPKLAITLLFVDKQMTILLKLQISAIGIPREIYEDSVIKLRSGEITKDEYITRVTLARELYGISDISFEIAEDRVDAAVQAVSAFKKRGYVTI